MTKFYITKYAVTKGIEVIDAEEITAQYADPKQKMIHGKSKWGLDIFFHGEGIEWHRTPEAALHRAEEMRASAIKSAEKKLAKLRAVKFEIPT